MTDSLAEARRIVLEGLKGRSAQVYLFGSRARGNARRWSDIDVAVLPLEQFPAGLLSSIREALEESHIPFTVDLLDLSDADPAFRTKVLSEGIPWTA